MPQAMSNPIRPNLSVLRSAPLLAILPDPELRRLRDESEMIRVRTRTTLLDQSADTGAVCFMISGFAKIERHDGHDRIAIAMLGPGEIFGELSALYGGPRSASVVTLTDCTTLLIPAAAFLRCMRIYAEFSFAVARHLADRLVKADRKIELFRGPVAPRVEDLLNDWRKLGVPNSVRLSQVEMARMLGCSRETIGRTVAQIEARRNKLPKRPAPA